MSKKEEKNVPSFNKNNTKSIFDLFFFSVSNASSVELNMLYVKLGEANFNREKTLKMKEKINSFSHITLPENGKKRNINEPGVSHIYGASIYIYLPVSLLLIRI